MTDSSDLLVPGLRIVIAGSAADAAQPYAAKGDRLWETLHAIGLTPRQLEPAEWRTLPEFGLGLVWLAEPDPSGADRGVRFEGGKEFRRKIREFAPGMLVFNGKQTAKDYFQMPTVAFGLLPNTIGTTKLFVCPSTKAGAKSTWDPRWWDVMSKLA